MPCVGKRKASVWALTCSLQPRSFLAELDQDRAIKLKWECLVEEARRHQGEEFLHTRQKAHKVKEPEASKAGHAYWAYAMTVADGDHPMG